MNWNLEFRDKMIDKLTSLLPYSCSLHITLFTCTRTHTSIIQVTFVILDDLQFSSTITTEFKSTMKHFQNLQLEITMKFYRLFFHAQ